MDRQLPDGKRTLSTVRELALHFDDNCQCRLVTADIIKKLSKYTHTAASAVINKVLTVLIGTSNKSECHVN